MDDESLVQNYLTDILTSEGHKIDVITNGNEAIDGIINGDYDVVLLDIKLPGKSGIELYRQVRKRAKSSSERIIFITGDVIGQETEAFLTKTKVPYITKPIDTTLLTKEMQKVQAKK